MLLKYIGNFDFNLSKERDCLWKLVLVFWKLRNILDLNFLVVYELMVVGGFLSVFKI